MARPTDSARLGIARLGRMRLGWRGTVASAELTVAAVAQAIVDRVNASIATQPARLWDPGMSGQNLPALIVTPPSIDVSTNRAQIGYRDWLANFPAAVVVDAGNLPVAQTLTTEMLEELIIAIDDDRDLAGMVDECRVIDVSTPDLDPDQPSAPLVTQLHIEAQWQERL